MKILKKRNPKKRYVFEHRPGAIFNSFGDEKVVQNPEKLMQMRSVEGKYHFWRKCVLHRPCRCARHLAPCQNHEKSTKNSEQKLKKRRSKNDDPPRAIFNDFGSILEVPGDPKITKKQEKEGFKKEAQKRLLSLIAPECTPDGS